MATSSTGGGRFGGPRRRRTAPDRTVLSEVSGRITAIEPQQGDAKRRSVYVDGNFAVGLHEETIWLSKWKIGQTVDGPALLAALERDEAKRAWDDALVYLAVTARTRCEVERKLGRLYPPELVASVIGRLVECRWLDDAEVARSYIRSHRNYGEQRLRQELQRRGVERSVAQAVIHTEVGAVDSVAAAREAAAGRLKRMQGVDRETAQRRLAGFLGRRGYGFDTISRALAPLLSELPRAQQSLGNKVQGRTGWRRWEEESP